MAASSSSSEMVIMPSFKFFKVPFDVRLIIYEYLFVGTQMTVKHTKICPGDCVAKKRSLKDCKENLTYELAFSPPQSLDALRTCRQFYKEAFRVLASQTTHLRLPETMVKAGCELFAAPTPPKWRLLKAILPFITCVELPTDLPFDFRLVPQLSHLIVPIDFDLADGPYDCVKRLAKELNRDDCIRGAQVLAAYSREVYWKPAASYEESLKPCEGVTMHCKSIWSHGKQVNGTDTFSMLIDLDKAQILEERISCDHEGDVPYPSKSWLATISEIMEYDNERQSASEGRAS